MSTEAESESNDHYIITASQLATFWTCRELYRRRYIDLLERPSIHRVFGQAAHKGPELFWKGEPLEKCFSESLKIMQAFDQSGLTVKEREKFNEMTRYLPDVLSVYFSQHESDYVRFDPGVENSSFIEFEWVRERFGVKLAGKLDRLTASSVLYDIKTISTVGSDWKANARIQFAQDIGLRLYDWYSRPERIIVELLIKPYKSNGPSYDSLDLTAEIVGNRAVFEQQLQWKVSELRHYLMNYSSAKPWPMSESACVTKYGQCEFVNLCLYGDSKKELARFSKREKINTELESV